MIHIAPIWERTGVVAGFVLRRQYTTVASVLYEDGVGPDGEPVVTPVEVDVVVASAVPLLSNGVLFAQLGMWRPTSWPTAPAAPLNQKSWLHYNSTTGLYWNASTTPATAGDALLGWVVCDGTGVILTSSRQLGGGDEETVAVPVGPVLPANEGMAPNVTGASVSVAYVMVGNDPFALVQGSFNLPTTDPNYARLKSVVISATGPGGTVGLELCRLYAPFSGTSLVFNALAYIPLGGGANSGSWTATFAAVNDTGSVTASPATAAFTIDRIGVYSVVGSDTAVRDIDLSNQLTSTSISAVPTLLAADFPQNISLWLSKGALFNEQITAAGAGYTPGTYALGFGSGNAAGTFIVNGSGHVSSVAITSGGDSYTGSVALVFAGAGAGSGAAGTADVLFDYAGWQLMSQAGQALLLNELVPGAAQTWIIAAATGAIQDTGPTPSAVLTGYPYYAAVSGGFTVATLGAPSATAITDGGLGVATCAVATGGAGYTAGTYTVTAAAGGAQIKVTCAGGVATVASVVAPGKGYLTPPSFGGGFGGGAGATFTVTIGAYQFIDAYGVPDWAIAAVTFTTPGKKDKNAWSTVLTFRATDAAGNPAAPENGGVEVAVGEWVNDGQLAVCTDIADYGFQPTGDTHTYGELKIYQFSRNVDVTKANFLDTTHCILQTGAFGGASYLRVAFGTPASNTLRLDKTDSTTLGLGLAVDGSNKPKANLGNGLTTSSGAITVNLGNGLTLSGAAVTLNLGNGLQMSGAAVQANLGNGLTLSGSAITLNLGNGLQMSGAAVQANLGGGLTMSGGAIAVNLGNGMTLSGGQLTLNVGNGVQISGGVVQANLGNGTTLSGGAITVNLGGGLTMSGAAVAVNGGTGLTVGVTLSISNGGVGPTQISSVNVSQLNAGTMTVGSGGISFSGTGGVSVLSGGNIAATPGYVAGAQVYSSAISGMAYYVTGGVGVINVSGQFVGTGVYCPSYGVAGSGFNPYVGGTQYYGQSLTYQIADTNGGLHTVKGGVIVS